MKMNENLLNELRGRSKNPIKETVLRFDFYNDKIEDVNRVLNSRGLHDLSTFEQFWDLYRSGNQDERIEVFGEEFLEFAKGNKIGTFTRNREQFRVWNGLPARIGSEHVDSMGDNLVFQAYGDPSVLESVKDIVFPYKQQSSIDSLRLSNGTTLYLPIAP
jgi:hypothetical protein